MRINTAYVVSAVTLLVLVVLSTATLAQVPVTINGHVSGRHGDPKQFVGVSFDGPGHYVAITDAQGAFTIENVTAGRYTVRVRQGDLVEVFTRDVGSGGVDLVVRW